MYKFSESLKVFCYRPDKKEYQNLIKILQVVFHMTYSVDQM